MENENMLIEETRIRVIKEIESQYDADLRTGCDTGYGFYVKSTPEDVVIWERGLALIPEGALTIDVFGADDTLHTISVSQAKAIPAMQTVFFQSLCQKKWRLITRAKTLGTEEELNAICWRNEV